MRETHSLACLGVEWTDRQPGKADQGHMAASLKCKLASGLQLGLVVWETREEAVKVVLLGGGTELAWENGGGNGKEKKPGGTLAAGRLWH